MLPLYLLASHLVGDFVLQTRWQAARKLTCRAHRARHCFTYTLAFAPLATWKTHDWAHWAHPHGWNWRYSAFMGGLFVLHYLTDSRRFRSTLGDIIAWRYGPGRRERSDPDGFADWKLRPLGGNPWEPLPILIDQTLHVAQLAALGWLLS